MKKILFTGPPRVGKTTLIGKIIHRHSGPATGFITKEIRKKNQRQGFSIITLEGTEALLAHVNHNSRYRVGKYGVYIDNLDNIAVPSLIPDSSDTLIVVDEIGKMECLSELFKKTVLQILDSDNPLIGTIALKSDSFISSIKQREDVSVIEVTMQNRDELVGILS